MSNVSKIKHDEIQANLAAFKARSNNMIDFGVYKEIQSGNDNIESISQKLRIKASMIKAHISKNLFNINENTVNIIE